MDEYYTYKRAYDKQYDTVYYMAKDDHFGKYTEINERYNVRIATEGQKPPTPPKETNFTLIWGIVGTVLGISTLVTLCFVFKHIRRRQLQKKADERNDGAKTSRFKTRPVPSKGSKIQIVSREISVVSPRLNISMPAPESLQHTTEHDPESILPSQRDETHKSHLMIDEDDNMVFKLHSSRNKRRLIDMTQETPRQLLPSEGDEIGIEDLEERSLIRNDKQNL